MEPKLTRPVLPVVIAGASLFTLVVVLVVAVILSLQARTALCVYKASVDRGVQNSRDFLALSPEEREARYGRALAHIPDSVLRRSLADQERTARSLSALHC